LRRLRGDVAQNLGFGDRIQLPVALHTVLEEYAAVHQVVAPQSLLQA
jgi:hypothetical protein